MLKERILVGHRRCRPLLLLVMVRLGHLQSPLMCKNDPKLTFGSNHPPRNDHNSLLFRQLLPLNENLPRYPLPRPHTSFRFAYCSLLAVRLT